MCLLWCFNAFVLCSLLNLLRMIIVYFHRLVQIKPWRLLYIVTSIDSLIYSIKFCPHVSIFLFFFLFTKQISISFFFIWRIKMNLQPFYTFMVNINVNQFQFRCYRLLRLINPLSWCILHVMTKNIGTLGFLGKCISRIKVQLIGLDWGLTRYSFMLMLLPRPLVG